eukprot:969386-Pyramimonas_sp.AAC.1
MPGALGLWDGPQTFRECPRPPQDSSKTAVEHHGRQQLRPGSKASGKPPLRPLEHPDSEGT